MRGDAAMMARWIGVVVAAGLVHLGCAGSALGDGKGFVRAVENVATPDQRVAIVFDGAVQTLIVDTTLTTGEREAAWIVPVPSEPVIEAVSTGFFPTLEVVFGARVVRVSPVWLSVLPGMVIPFLLARLVRNPWLRATIVVPAVLFTLVVLLLPSLSRATSRPIPVAGATVLARERVGVFDTAVIRGESGSAAAVWLKNEGFHVPDGVAPVLDAYAKDGWCFAAARVDARDNGAASGGAIRPHPLVFRFQTTKAVYPLRLTGVQGAPCKVKLWVFGQERAVVDGLQSRLVAHVQGHSGGEQARAGEFRRLQHSAVAAWLGGQPVVTVLEGVLTPERMTQDAWVSWRPAGKGKAWNVYQHKEARTRAIDGGLAVAISGFAMLLASVGPSRPPLRRIGLALIAAGPLVGAWLFLSVERVETRKVSIHVHNDDALASVLARARRSAGPSASCDALIAHARAEMEAAAEGDWGWRGATASPDSRISEGDAPNQYTLRCRDGRLTAVYIDLLGREQNAVEPDEGP